MITYYRTRRGEQYIKAVTVEAESPKMVLLPCEMWVRKRGAEYQYHPTFEHAKHYLLRIVKAKLAEAELMLEHWRLEAETLQNARPNRDGSWL